MFEKIIVSEAKQGIGDPELREALRQSLAGRDDLKKVLLIPPDLTRMHSGAGKIAAIYYELLQDRCEVDVLPALGTHEPMTGPEIDEFFCCKIPRERIINHNWRTGVVKIGEVPGSFVSDVSEGLINDAVAVEINRRLLDPAYDLIISIGQVVPHEVVGMANYSKNIFVGCGGSAMINSSHMLGAVYGMERMMGRDRTPVRQVFDYAEEHFLQKLPLMYVLTVTTQIGSDVAMHGLFIGRERRLFEAAVKLSQQKNLTYVDKPLPKVVVYLDEREFKSTWLGNKAIYRTRMAIADGGELIILAPGVRKFGEDDENDKLIRKYGYVGRQKVLALSRQNADLCCNLSVAAHLIHGSADGRFSVTYAVSKLTRQEVEGVGFHYLDLAEALKTYDPQKLKNGYNRLDSGEEIFYISNPALGLWASQSKFV